MKRKKIDYYVPIEVLGKKNPWWLDVSNLSLSELTSLKNFFVEASPCSIRALDAIIVKESKSYKLDVDKRMVEKEKQPYRNRSALVRSRKRGR